MPNTNRPGRRGVEEVVEGRQELAALQADGQVVGQQFRSLLLHHADRRQQRLHHQRPIDLIRRHNSQFRTESNARQRLS